MARNRTLLQSVRMAVERFDGRINRELANTILARVKSDLPDVL
jgi:hypothetical protein